jgi:hypothetical protein
MKPAPRRMFWSLGVCDFLMDAVALAALGAAGVFAGLAAALAAGFLAAVGLAAGMILGLTFEFFLATTNAPVTIESTFS